MLNAPERSQILTSSKMSKAFEFFLCGFCSFLVQPPEKENAPKALQCSACHSLFCEDCCKINMTWECPKPMCKTKKAPEKVHFKVMEILCALQVFCPGCQKCHKYKDIHAHVSQCDKVTDRMRITESDLGDKIAQNLSTLNKVDYKGGLPMEIFVFDKDRLRVFVYNRISCQLSVHPIEYKPTGNDLIPKSKQSS